MPGKGYQPKYIYGVPNPNASEPERAGEMDGDVQAGFRGDFAYDDALDDSDLEEAREYAQDAMEDALAMRGMGFDRIDEQDPQVQEFYDECASDITLSYGQKTSGGHRSVEAMSKMASEKAEKFLDGYLDGVEKQPKVTGDLAPHPETVSIDAARKARQGFLTPEQAQEIILSSGGAQGAADLADAFGDSPGVDIGALQQVVIASGRSDQIYDFAVKVPGADTETLQSALIDTGNTDTMIDFAHRVDGADIGALQEAVIASGSPSGIGEFFEVDGADIDRLSDALIATGDGYAIAEVATGDGYAIAEVATNPNIKGVDFDRFQDAVLDTEDIYGALEMITDPRSDRSRLQEVIIEHGDVDDWKHIKQFSGVDTAKLNTMIADHYGIDVNSLTE